MLWAEGLPLLTQPWGQKADQRGGRRVSELPAVRLLQTVLRKSRDSISVYTVLNLKLT